MRSTFRGNIQAGDAISSALASSNDTLCFRKLNQSFLWVPLKIHNSSSTEGHQRGPEELSLALILLATGWVGDTLG